MKLPDFFQNAEMNALRAGMGLRPDEFGDFQAQVDPGRLTAAELDKLISGEGIDIAFEELTILPDGTLAYKDSRVLLYIRDHHPFHGNIPDPKFHLCNCDVLDRMRRNKRFNRYVIATEETGTFWINIIEDNLPRGERRKLGVCQICLEKLAFEGFKISAPKPWRQDYVAKFLPQKFFDLYPRNLIIQVPPHTAVTAPINNYPENWGEKSRVARNAANWTCSKCHLVLTVHKKKHLQVHHRNGLRNDCRPENLMVVCIGCHAEEPEHQHMRSAPAYAQFKRETGWRPRR